MTMTMPKTTFFIHHMESEDPFALNYGCLNAFMEDDTSRRKHFFAVPYHVQKNLGVRSIKTTLGHSSSKAAAGRTVLPDILDGS